jgi:hypothetical protein
MGHTTANVKKDAFVPKATDVCVFVKLAAVKEDSSLLFVLFFEGSCIHFEEKGSEI